MAEMIDIDTLLAWGGTFKKVFKGDIIFLEDCQARYYHQLVTGAVRWVNIDSEGREFTQMIIEEGECFGELPMFDDRPYAATTIANTDAVVIRLPKQNFLQLLEENTLIHFQFSKLMSERLRYKFFLLKEMAHQNPEHLITALFRYFRQYDKHTCPKCHMIKLTRQQLADITGLRIETVIRTIRSLNDKGILSIKKGKVFLEEQMPLLN